MQEKEIISVVCTLISECEAFADDSVVTRIAKCDAKAAHVLWKSMTLIGRCRECLSLVMECIGKEVRA